MFTTDPQRFIEVWYILAIFYFVFMWGIPMLGMSTNRWVMEAEGAERKRRYWSGVRVASLAFHLGTIGAFTLMYFLEPYLLGQA